MLKAKHYAIDLGAAAVLMALTIADAMAIKAMVSWIW
jgi:hypothetical protein